MNVDAIRAYLATEFSQVFADGCIEVVSAEGGAAQMTLTPGFQHLRPGNIISGPSMMMMADAGAYAALLSLDEGAKMAVTSDLTIHFLRAAPEGGRLIQEARVIKAGRRISVIACGAMSEDGRLLAHATMSYAMPT